MGQRHGLKSTLVFGAVLLASPQVARASSEFINGRFAEHDPAAQSYDDPGVCDFITGPRADLGAGRFLMTVGDHHVPDTAELRLTGAYSAVTIDQAGDQRFTLYVDRTRAAAWFGDVLRRQTGDKYATFRLNDLSASATQAPRARLLCQAHLTGTLTPSRAGAMPVPVPVNVDFGGQGQYFPGNPTAPRTQAAARTSPCSTAELAPLGLAPIPDKCTSASCLVDFDHYRWWTSFNYRGDGSYFPGGGYFYNGGLRTAFAPNNVSVDAEGLHLRIAKQNLGGGLATAGAEAVLMFHEDGSPADLGYGDYLVTARIKSTRSWASLDPNVAFGLFTFERLGKGSENGTPNPFREIDLAEVSRWGWDGAGKCPIADSRLCTGNAQFALQIHDRNPLNVHRYTVRDGVNTVTLVMRWHGAGQPVTFNQYDGAFGFANLPGTPDRTWTSAADQDQFIPATACERFHINLWLGNFTAGGPSNPPPRTDQDVVITDFGFRPER